MTREALYRWIDRCLDEMGYDDDITLPWGIITFQVNYEAGKVVLRVKERETQKDVTKP